MRVVAIGWFRTCKNPQALSLLQLLRYDWLRWAEVEMQDYLEELKEIYNLCLGQRSGRY